MVLCANTRNYTPVHLLTHSYKHIHTFAHTHTHTYANTHTNTHTQTTIHTQHMNMDLCTKSSTQAKPRYSRNNQTHIR